MQPEVPEGLVATEIKCNNGDIITAIPLPTQRYLKLRLKAAGLEDNSEEQREKQRERELINKMDFYNEQLMHLQTIPSVPVHLHF